MSLPPRRTVAALVLALGVLATPGARASEVDPATLYSVSTAGSTSALKVGQSGTFVLEVKSLQGAHVSDEAPLRLALAGSGPVTPSKTALAYGDSVRKKSTLVRYPDPRFEVPFTATAKGAGTLEARLTLFVCTADLCLRQQRTFSVPVTVE